MKSRLRSTEFKNSLNTELPTFVALAAIGRPWFNESHRADLQAIAPLAEMLAPRDCDTCADACTMLSALGEDLPDPDTILPAAVDVSDLIQRQPANI